MLVLASAGLVRADVIFTNGALSSVDGNEMSGWIQANAFTLNDTSRITGVSFYALALTQAVYNGSIDWGFYADESGTPGELLVTGLQTVTAVDAGPAELEDYELFRFDFALSEGFVATGGTQYWLGLHNGSLEGDENSGLYMAFATSGAAGQEKYLLGEGFTGNENPHWFELKGVAITPEPGTWMLAAGALGLIAMRVRRRGSSAKFRGVV